MESNYLPLIGKSPVINETNEVVNCLHPRIVVNPSLGDLIYKYKNYTYFGRTVHVNPRSARTYSSYFPKYYFHPSEDFDLNDLNECYVTDFSTGESFPMYFAVPCGHCDICKQAKIDSFSHRCELETQCYNHLPFFVTLTYRDSDLHPDGLSVRDGQLFLKRLRARLSYAGWNDRFRYVLVGEYGHNTHRMHLHCLIWNLYPTRDIKFYQIRQMVHDSWQHGFTYLSIVSPSYIVKGSRHGFSKPENCFKYVAKYISKDSDVPQGKNNTFICTSRRHGGIGAPFLDRHKLYIRQHLTSDFKYKDVFTGKVKSLQFFRYTINRIFPSFCQSVPLELRNAVRQLCISAPFVKHSDSYMNILQAQFKDLFWPRHYLSDLGRNCEFEEKFLSYKSVPGSCSLGIHEVKQNIDILLKYKDFDFDKSLLLANKRNLFLSKIFEHRNIKYLVPRATSIRYYRELSLQREVF